MKRNNNRSNLQCRKRLSRHIPERVAQKIKYF